ncbi:MAG: catabolite control protein A, partial [Clostridium sp.]|nr:catabolite control protein A [Clostridium sp.]
VKQPGDDVGSLAMRMLIKILNSKPLEEAEFILSHELVERESCK